MPVAMAGAGGASCRQLPVQFQQENSFESYESSFESEEGSNQGKLRFGGPHRGQGGRAPAWGARAPCSRSEGVARGGAPSTQLPGVPGKWPLSTINCVC